MNITKILLIVVLGSGLLGVSLDPASAAPEAIFTVNRTDDLPDANPGDDICAVSRGGCTLRAAVMEANAHPSKDIINLPPGTYALTRIGNDNTSLDGDLDIQHELEIKSTGTGYPVIENTIEDRVITIMGFAQVTMTRVKIKGGNTSGNGGGILNTGALSLNDTVIEGNTAAKKGGGIYTASGEYTAAVLKVVYSTITQNTAGTGGGGIFNNGTLTLELALVSHNLASEGGGGGIYNDGDLTLTNSFVNNNTADREHSSSAEGGGINNRKDGVFTLTGGSVKGNSAYDGGGIYNYSGIGTLSKTKVQNNNAGLQGGGINNVIGTVNLIDSTVRNNTAWYGGGISNSPEGGTNAEMNIYASTISANTAEFDGGGIFNRGKLRLTNGTVSGNNAGGTGGGIFHFAGQTRLYSVTISDNTADTAGAHAGEGGGVYVANHPTAGTLRFKNTIIAENYNFDKPSGALFGEECAGTLKSDGYNLIWVLTSNCTITGNTTGNLTGQDPKLRILKNYGGPTHTHGLLPDSIAVNAGNPSGCKGLAGFKLTTDQRGEPRPTSNRPRCDIGAYELQQ